jgi:Deoxyribonuclease II
MPARSQGDDDVCCGLGVSLLLGAVLFVVAGAGVAVAEPFREDLPRCVGVHEAHVTWWLVLKHPAGYGYSYLDSQILRDCDPRNSSGACWLHGLMLGSHDPLAATLGVLRAPAQRAALAYVVYNDEDASGVEHWDAAHAKGVLVGGCGARGVRCGGFWLQHSAPAFPGQPGHPGFAQLAHAQSVFGQHFACFSLEGGGALDGAARALAAAAPFLLASGLPAGLAASLPGWAALLEHNRHSGEAGLPPQPNVTRAELPLWHSDTVLRVLSKPAALNLSLPDDVVVPLLGTSMAWETWRRSHDALPSRCTRDDAPVSCGQAGGAGGMWGGDWLSSLNVAAVAFPASAHGWSWPADHSKWGVTLGQQPMRAAVGAHNAHAVRHQTAWHLQQQEQLQQEQQEQLQQERFLHAACFGDLNRAAWQAHRGGAYVCLHHTRLWAALRSIVAKLEPCQALPACQ